MLNPDYEATRTYIKNTIIQTRQQSFFVQTLCELTPY